MENPNVSQAKPQIPHRSLKPATQDERNAQRPDKHTSSSQVSGKDTMEGGDATGQSGNDALAAVATASSMVTREEDLGEIARRRHDSKLQEQRAQAELLRMRQDKMRTENKQLRQEKAMVERELEEKVRRPNSSLV